MLKLWIMIFMYFLFDFFLLKNLLLNFCFKMVAWIYVLVYFFLNIIEMIEEYFFLNNRFIKIKKRREYSSNKFWKLEVFDLLE